MYIDNCFIDSSLRWNDYCLFAVNYEIIDFVNNLSPHGACFVAEVLQGAMCMGALQDEGLHCVTHPRYAVAPLKRF